jgi:hypothetical protein
MVAMLSETATIILCSIFQKFTELMSLYATRVASSENNFNYTRSLNANCNFGKTGLVAKRIKLFFGIQKEIMFHRSTVNFHVNKTKSIKVNRT